MRVVGRELREEDLPLLQELPGAGEIGDVGRGLSREDRIAVQPQFLGALDLAVPIGPLTRRIISRRPVRPARSASQSMTKGARF
jgi:hypothetical protein